ncbi:MAG TPA: DUF3568 family protein [Candidatus Sulfotelmatobacter sp.]|jgi:hypothetical protein|nr:DUF3568 family protein [Candidatus Sulfotelmatobacter sp.]
MKKTITLFAILAGAAFVITGCVNTVTDQSSFAPVPWTRDSVAGRYNRTVDQVYQASLYVIQHNGVLITEYIPHDNTNDTRSLSGRVNDTKVWVRVSSVDARTSQIDVQARTKWGSADVDLSHELEKEVALELSAH